MIKQVFNKRRQLHGSNFKSTSKVILTTIVQPTHDHDTNFIHTTHVKNSKTIHAQL